MSVGGSGGWCSTSGLHQLTSNWLNLHDLIMSSVTEWTDGPPGCWPHSELRQFEGANKTRCNYRPAVRVLTPPHQAGYNCRVNNYYNNHNVLRTYWSFFFPTPRNTQCTVRNLGVQGDIHSRNLAGGTLHTSEPLPRSPASISQN